MARVDDVGSGKVGSDDERRGVGRQRLMTLDKRAQAVRKCDETAGVEEEWEGERGSEGDAQLMTATDTDKRQRVKRSRTETHKCV